jgi:hypothetical protein
MPDQPALVPVPRPRRGSGAGREAQVERPDVGPDPTRDSSPAAGQDDPDEEPRQARGGPRVEGRRDAGKPVARRGQWVR